MYYYKVQLSNGVKVLIDDSELAAVQEGVAKRSPMVICKRGVFNSAFYVAIVPDQERNREYSEEKRLGIEGEEEFPMIPVEQRKALGDGK